MSNKTLSIVSYITLIGWLVSFFARPDKKDELVNYHLEQSLGLIITSFALNIIFTILAGIISAFSYVSMAVGIVLLILLILGCITASKVEKKPLPIIGAMFENKCNFSRG